MALTPECCWDPGKHPSLVWITSPLSGLKAICLRWLGVWRAGLQLRYGGLSLHLRWCSCWLLFYLYYFITKQWKWKFSHFLLKFFTYKISVVVICASNLQNKSHVLSHCQQLQELFSLGSLVVICHVVIYYVMDRICHHCVPLVSVYIYAQYFGMI